MQNVLIKKKEERERVEKYDDDDDVERACDSLWCQSPKHHHQSCATQQRA